MQLDTNEFLKYVWPASGYKFIITDNPKRPDGAPAKPSIHYPHMSVAGAVEQLEHFESKGRHIWFSCASFVEPQVDTGQLNQWGKPKLEYRTQDNAAFVRALWVDLDCGEGKDYASQKDALQDLVRFIKLVGLPQPLVVNSGNGIHGYLAFSDEIPADQWKPIALKWRAALDHAGVKHDTSRTKDVASILRPVGTSNRKGAPKPVRIVGKVPERVSADQLEATLDAYLGENDVPLVQFAEPGRALNSDLAIERDYPPSSALEIAEKCQQVKAFARSRGDVDEPVWHKMIGLLKHTIEAPQICHDWSEGHPDYDARDTESKIAQWGDYGPTTCEMFKQVNAAGCEGCAFAGKVKSPIQLGQQLPQATPEELAAVSEAPQEDPIEASGMPTSAGDFKMPERLAEIFSYGAGGLFIREEDEDRGHVVKRFCHNLLFPLSYYDRRSGADKDQRSLWRLYHRGHVTDFELPASVQLGDPKTLMTTLGRAGVMLEFGGKKAMERYIHEWFNELRANADETQTYTTFGWHDEKNFLLGDTLYTPSGERSVKVQGDAARYVPYFEEQGSAHEWAEVVDQAYNHEGYEQYQWMVGTGFGAPLVALMGNMSGCVVNGFSTETGLGKSTAGKIGLGLYGNPEKLILTKQQATTRGLFAFAGMMNSLPILLDEVTNTRGQELSDLVYTFSQGTGRLGGTADGGIRANIYGWATLMASTSNRSLQTTLAAHKASASPEIARVFEYRFVRPTPKRTRNEYDVLFERAMRCYGAAGKNYIRYVVQNREKVLELLLKVRRALVEKGGVKQDERFWVAGATAVLTGLMIGKKLGLVGFDIKALQQWALKQVAAMRDVVGETEMDTGELFGTMLNELSSGLLVTKQDGDARASGRAADVLHPPRGDLVGRVVVDTQTLYLPVSVVRHWCSEKQVDYRNLVNDLAVRGWAKMSPVPISLGRGTVGYATAPSRCFTINLALAGGEIGSTVENVVQMRAVK